MRNLGVSMVSRLIGGLLNVTRHNEWEDRVTVNRV